MAALREPIKECYCPGCHKVHAVGWPPMCITQYNSLEDPHLKHFINNPVWYKQLLQSGLIDAKGRAISARTHRRTAREKEREDQENEQLVKEIVERSIELESYREAMIQKAEDRMQKKEKVKKIKTWRANRGNTTSRSNAIDEEDDFDVDNDGDTPRRDLSYLGSDSDSDIEYDSVVVSTTPSNSSQGNDQRIPIEFEFEHASGKEATLVVHQHIAGKDKEIIYKNRSKLKPKETFVVPCKPNNGRPIELLFYVDGKLSAIFIACCYYKCKGTKTRPPASTKNTEKSQSFECIVHKEPKEGRPCNKCQLDQAYGKPRDDNSG